MQHEFLQRGGQFLYAGDSYSLADWVMFGIPMDWTTSFRPGARMAPARIREVSQMGMEWYSPTAQRSLEDLCFYDAGDVDVVIGDVEKTLRRVRQVADVLLADGKRTLAIGGEHLVSLPLIQAAAHRHPDLVVLHFDAHTDLRQEFFGNRLSHATVLRHAYESLRPGHLYQFGIRSGDRDEFAWAAEHIHQYRDEVLEPLRSCLKELQGYPIYITLDIDVMDPAYAPGTGTPEAGGISSLEMLRAIRAMSDLQVVGMDLVEVSPLVDADGRTSVLAAKIIREALLEFRGEGENRSNG